jgi:hypothetical protein
MLDDGKITQHEYEVVKTELLQAPSEDWAGGAASPSETEADVPGTGQEQVSESEDDVSVPDHDPLPGSGDSETPEWLTFARGIPTLYWVSIGGTILTVFFAASLLPMAWITTAVAVAALVRVKEARMRWMAWTGLGAGVIFSAIGLFGSDTAGTVDASALPAATATPAQLDEVPVDSLGLRFDDLTTGWNGLPDPPHVLRGIRTNPEPGPLDSFIYTFDSGAILAGAYNPADEFVYALMVKANFADPDISNYYVHLCYLLYPGTQDCFDAYVEESGVFGKSPDDWDDGHVASYVFDGNEWRVEIVGDVLTLRVLGPRQTG